MDTAVVEVVPTSMPMTIAAAWANESVPASTAASAMATPALDDWVTTVTAAPIPTRSRRPAAVSGGKSSGETNSWKPAMPRCIASRPRKRSANPATAQPVLATFPRPNSRKSTPRKRAGSTKRVVSSSNPRSATSHPVAVVPMFAPNTTPSARGNAKRPALTKPTVATVVTLDDWSTAVSPAPVRAPVVGLFVQRKSTRCTASPARDRSPSVRTIIPRRKSPSPPSDWRTSSATGRPQGRPGEPGRRNSSGGTSVSTSACRKATRSAIWAAESPSGFKNASTCPRFLRAGSRVE